ncbi:T9SS type A sorting domain-containing protein [Candidatus Poribacteria bacterium]|nr:T9SS type A sorting domain-containing protein [Candidatus Poribacteria bacterium]
MLAKRNMNSSSVFYAIFLCLLMFPGLANTQIPPPPEGNFPALSDYIAFLSHFPKYAEQVWHGSYQGDEQLGYFGQGVHDHNQVRVLSNCIFMYALLATDDAYDEAISGVSREELLAHALSALRYFTATHVTGWLNCVDGRKWGKQPGEWVTSWNISKGVAGARLIWNELTGAEKAALRRVVAYEANYHLTHPAYSKEYEVSYSTPNAINAEGLTAAVVLYPEHPNAEKWLQKAKELFMNSLSVAADATDSTVVDGRRVQNWVYTVNVHPDFTIENHGGYQFDYCVVPLHSLAWAYYALLSHGQPVPESFFHHVADVWNTAKRTFLYQGRFAYLHGQDWARHVYGLYFIMPALVMFQHEWQDSDARLVEILRFNALAWEQGQNWDGGVFSGRLYYQQNGWPLIYDTDCYANLGLAYLLHQRAPLISPTPMDVFQTRMQGCVISKPIEAVYGRSNSAFISFSWRALSGQHPLALFVPGDDYIVEWRAGNVVGDLTVAGRDMDTVSSVHNEEVVDDGFVTTGQMQVGRNAGGYGVDRYISFAGLPGDSAAIILDYAVAKEDIVVSEQRGLSYYLPNDIFNGNYRNLYWQGGQMRLSGWGAGREYIPISSRWLNIDDKLGIISVLDNYHFTVQDEYYRHPWYGELHEQIHYPLIRNPQYFSSGDVIREVCFLLTEGNRETTEKLANANLYWMQTPEPMLKAVYFQTSKNVYLLVANFSQEPKSLTLTLPDEATLSIDVPALSTQLKKLSHAEAEIGFEPQGKLLTTLGQLKHAVLFQNYPNPFNPETWIPYELRFRSEVTIRIYGLNGQLIRTIALGKQPAGLYLTKKRAVHWDGRNNAGELVASGVYFYTLQVGDWVITRKLIVQK